MRLLIVISSLDDGGAARMVSDITALLPDEWDIDILLAHSETVRYSYRGRIISLDMKEPKSRTNLSYSLRLLCRRYKMLRKLKKENNYDVCLSFLESSNFSNILSGNKYCKTMVVVVNHMSEEAKYSWKYRYIVNPLIRLLYNKANKVVACTDECKRDLAEKHGVEEARLTRIYPSVDLDSVREILRGKKIPPEDIEWFNKDTTIVSAGRLCRQKGQWHLIRAFSSVVNTIPDAKLVIFGDGELKEYFHKLILDYGLQNNVNIRGFSRELPVYIQGSAAFVLPSLYEGFPTAMVMALACGVPCIASDFKSGAREQLEPDYWGEINEPYQGAYGILTSPFDDEMPSANEELSETELNLAEAIKLILQDKELRERYGCLSLQRSGEFDSEIICQQWKSVIVDTVVGDYGNR